MSATAFAAFTCWETPSLWRRSAKLLGIAMTENLLELFLDNDENFLKILLAPPAELAESVLEYRERHEVGLP